MTIAGRPWADVRNELFGEPYMVWHDGPEFSGLRQAWRAEPDALIDQLVVGLGEGDALAAQSLSELDPAPSGAHAERIVVALQDSLRTAPPGARVQIGLTLYRLTGDPVWSEPIVEVLDGSVHWGDRIDAAIALRPLPPTPELRAALLRNVEDADYLVRYHSATTLLRWAGEQQHLDDADDALFALIARDDDPDAWRRAAVQLSAGSSPPSSTSTRL